MDKLNKYGLSDLNKYWNFLKTKLGDLGKKAKSETQELDNPPDVSPVNKRNGGRTRKGGLKFKAGINTDLDLDLGISLNKLLKRKTLRADTKKLLKKINKLTTNNKTKNVRKLKRRKSLNKKSRKRRN